jgi:hypothetical protein
LFTSIDNQQAAGYIDLTILKINYTREGIMPQQKTAGIILVAISFFCSLLMAANPDKNTENVTGVQIIKFGYSKGQTISEVRKVEGTASQNLVGYSNIVYLQEGATRIPAKYKAVMCITYKITGSPQGVPVEIQMRTIHPPILNPRTQVTSFTDEWTEDKTLGEVYFRGYEFANDWEIAPGNWTFEFWYNNRMLGSKKFTVYKPEK